MKAVVRYLLAFAPAALCLFAWQGSGWMVARLGCTWQGKSLSACYAGNFEVTPWLGAGVFWGQMLFIPAIVLSVILLAAAAELQGLER